MGIYDGQSPFVLSCMQRRKHVKAIFQATWRVCERAWSVFWYSEKRWKILDYGFNHCNIKTCSDIFVTCCCLHNIGLEIVKWMAKPPRVSRGMPSGTDGIWLGNPLDLMQREEASDCILATQWSEHCWPLAEHLKV